MGGYGFSGKPNTSGWDPQHIARAWIELMKRLGYKKFVAQGGDWGALITDEMGVIAPPELIGIHTNMAAVVPPPINKKAFVYMPRPPDFIRVEKNRHQPRPVFCNARHALPRNDGTRARKT